MVTQEHLKIALTRFPRLYELSRRPYALARFLARQPHEPEYAVFALFGDRDGLFLDIGANAGMSALSFRIYKRENPILSIEPNPHHSRDLEFAGRLVGGFSYLSVAAGDRPGVFTLHVPVYRGVPLTTEASLDLGAVLDSPSLRARLGDRMDGQDFTVVEKNVPVRRIDDMGLQPDFVKLDVQGFEYAVLMGMLDTLRKARPVLLVETPTEATYDLMAAEGYHPRAYDVAARRLTRDLENAGNVVFMPDEQRIREALNPD
jgi:FkbM family methyltransferase